MSEWITDRKPTEEDCAGVDRVPHSDHVWVMHEGKVTTCPFGYVVVGCPWQPLVVQMPEPYVKPKRWRVLWSDFRQCWAVRDCNTGATVYLRDDSMNFGLINRYDEHRQAAVEIAAIYERTMP